MLVRAVTAFLAVLLIVVPTNSSAIFDGVPFTDTAELVGFLAILYLCTSFPTRNAIWNRFRTLSRRPTTIIASALALAATFKLIVYLIAPTAGHFEVCYRHFNARSGTECVATFEPHPIISSQSQRFAQRSTTIPSIDFGSRTENDQGLSRSDWRLPFVNSEEFDGGFWPWDAAQKSIETFPFWAEIRGAAEIGEGEKIRVTYLGQGSMSLNSQRVLLPASYKAESTLIVSPESSEFNLTIDFAYLQTRKNSDDRSFPYAVLRVERVTGENTSVLEAGSTVLLRVANGITDGAAAALVLGLVWLARKSAIRIAIAIATALGCWGALLVNARIGFGALKFEAPIVLLSFLLLTLRRSKYSALLLVPSFVATGMGMTAREIESATGVWPQLSDIVVRLRGNDHLVYHALARDMLETGFFRGGEDVFYYQPGIRYLFYVQQVLFGESAVITGAVGVTLIGLGILFLTRQFGWRGRFATQVSYAFSLLTLMLWWSSSHTVQTTIFGLSEFGTWIILLFIFGVTLRPLSDNRLMLIGVLAAFIIWIRPNQGLAVLFLIGLVITVAVRRGTRLFHATRFVGLPFSAMLLLLPLHNLIFAGRLQFLPGGHTNADQSGWDTLIRLTSDGAARSFVLAQLRGLLYLPSASPDTFSIRLGVSVVCIFIVCLLAMSFTTHRHLRYGWITVFQLLTFFGQLVPFVNFSLYRYFPVHNIAIYLTLLLICMQRLSFAVSPEVTSEKSFEAPPSDKKH